jgi:CBS domain-containing protein
MKLAKHTVADIMTKEVVTADVSKPVIEVLRIMADKGIGCVVITEKGCPSGMVTERDIVRKIVQEKDVLEQRAEQVMTQPLISVPPDTNVIDALNLMRDKKIRRLPIVQDEQLRGIITIHSDLLYWVAKGGEKPL